MFRRHCAVCAEKDSQIAYLRGLIDSARTMTFVREPDIKAEIAQTGQRAEGPSTYELPPFTRNPVTVEGWQHTVGEDRVPVGEEVREDVIRVNEERRARIAARRMPNPGANTWSES